MNDICVMPFISNDSFKSFRWTIYDSYSSNNSRRNWTCEVIMVNYPSKFNKVLLVEYEIIKSTRYLAPINIFSILSNRINQQPLWPPLYESQKGPLIVPLFALKWHIHLTWKFLVCFLIKVKILTVCFFLSQKINK